MHQLRRLAAVSAYRFGSFVLRFRWIIVGGALSGLGIWDLVAKLPDPLMITAAAAGLGLVAFDLNNHLRAWRSTNFVPRGSETFRELNIQHGPGERHRIWEYPNGTFAYDEELSNAIESGLLARKAATGYALPPPLAAWGRRYLDWVFGPAGDKPYNDPILGWGTNINDVTEVVAAGVELIPSNYYNHISSDHLATVDITQDGDTLPNYGRRLFIDRYGCLRDFGDSWLLNGIGTSALAFTSDGMLVLVEQDKRNINSKAQMAPSGSGALDPVDMSGLDIRPLKHVAADGGNRELCQESAVEPTEVSSSRFLGFGRWLNKAGRPELFTLTFLSTDSHALRARPIRREERQYVRRVHFVRLNTDIGAWDEKQPDRMLPAAHRHAMSVPLSAALSMLAHNWDSLAEPFKHLIAPQHLQHQIPDEGRSL
ncbi:hypothetical protein [Paenarthrobacter sp. YIM B13468]|uniref:hypothetical protein n=1 Tax=Paenarthrobacter sp. YIM B13468 TaxID=3366295 RepID=UPI0036730B14